MNYIATRDGVVFPSSYLDYMEKRPRSHGLFGDDELVDLAQTKEEIDRYTGRVWTHILSLTREDADRLGYDIPEAWRELLQTHRNEIATAMHIPMKNFRWVASFHDEGEHPHVHMMAWSANPKEGYLDKDGIKDIKSELTNTIFQQEMLHLYDQKTQSRNQLLQEANRAISNASKKIAIENPLISQMMRTLSMELSRTTGKKSYGYLKKPVKKLVDNIVKELAKEPSVAECFTLWQDYQAKIASYYHDRAYDKQVLAEEKAFYAIKNVIIKEADRCNQNQSRNVQFDMMGLAFAVAQLFDDRTPPEQEKEQKREPKISRKNRRPKLSHGQSLWEMKR